MTIRSRLISLPVFLALIVLIEGDRQSSVAAV
jgi:hypothetical protein